MDRSYFTQIDNYVPVRYNLPMSKRIPEETINEIRTLRQQGWSMPEIRSHTNVGYGTIFRYIKGTSILPEYEKVWFGKRGGSRKRKQKKEIEAKTEAKLIVNNLSIKEKMLFLAALYWGEGSKGYFGLINSDPELISVFVKGLIGSFQVQKESIKISVRVYADLNKQECLKFWSNITAIPVKDFANMEIIKGKEKGKLPFGMCRVRVSKGGDLLKLIKAINKEVISIFSPRSSMDRTG